MDKSAVIQWLERQTGIELAGNAHSSIDELISSINLLLLVQQMEDDFHLTIDTTELLTIKTFQDLTDLIWLKTNAYAIPDTLGYYLDAAARDPVSLRLATDSNAIGQITGQCKEYWRQSVPLEVQLPLANFAHARLREPKTGFVLFRGLFAPQTDIAFNLIKASILCSLLGTQFKVISTGNLWNRLGVNPDKRPYESEGTGYNHLHIDVPNTTLIPPITCLLCETPDPAGGGASLFSHVAHVLDGLSPEELALGAREIFYEGRHFNLINVGEKYLPFPIFKRRSDWENNPSEPPFEFRFSGKMKFDPGNQAYLPLIEKIERLLVQGSFEILLQKGDLILVNQRWIAHGRLPLAGDQSKIPPEERRSIFQTKLKPDNEA